jgi:hypothetical protein
MRAALIPPKGYEDYALNSNIHLVLPLPPLIQNMKYLDVYQRAQRRGDFVILDNGCAEGQLVAGHHLLNVARAIRAHEIVAPDVMSDAAATLTATTNFIFDYQEARDYSIMAVLQGETPDERDYLLHQFAKMDPITTIGVPKVHVKKYGSEVRKDIVRQIHKNYPGRFHVHLLGLNSVFPTEMRDVDFHRVGGNLRSMDSAQPFKVTEERYDLEIEAWAPRRDDYFTKKKEVEARLLIKNIFTFRSWAEKHDRES